MQRGAAGDGRVKFKQQKVLSLLKYSFCNIVRHLWVIMKNYVADITDSLPGAERRHLLHMLRECLVLSLWGLSWKSRIMLSFKASEQHQTLNENPGSYFHVSLQFVTVTVTKSSWSSLSHSDTGKTSFPPDHFSLCLLSTALFQEFIFVANPRFPKWSCLIQRWVKVRGQTAGAGGSTWMWSQTAALSPLQSVWAKWVLSPHAGVTWVRTACHS